MVMAEIAKIHRLFGEIMEGKQISEEELKFQILAFIDKMIATIEERNKIGGVRTVCRELATLFKRDWITALGGKFSGKVIELMTRVKNLSDIIIGESDESFNHTYRVYKEYGFDKPLDLFKAYLISKRSIYEGKKGALVELRSAFNIEARQKWVA
jgi:hypothetical protein